MPLCELSASNSLHRTMAITLKLAFSRPISARATRSSAASHADTRLGLSEASSPLLSSQTCLIGYRRLSCDFLHVSLTVLGRGQCRRLTSWAQMKLPFGFELKPFGWGS